MADTAFDFEKLTKHMDVHVQLVGEDGNAFAIMGSASKAMRRAHKSQDEIDEYMAAATSGDYDRLLAVTMFVFNYS